MSTSSSTRAPSLVAGVALAVMAALSAIGLLLALPAGELEVAALAVLLVAALDIVVGVALFPVLAPGGPLLAGCAVAMRIAYGAVFVTAAGSLVGQPEVARFQAIWDAGLLLFGIHLALVGLAMARGRGMPTWIGVLVAITGLGYAADSVSAIVSPAGPLAIGEITFVGELVLMVWLIGWSGRSRTTPKERVVRDQVAPVMAGD
ncbi:DUF4386 domain-containing protein [Salana multivorans]